MTAPLVIIAVRGEPAGQGNLRTGPKHGKAYHANSKDLSPWRERVRGAALDVLGAHEFRPPTGEDRRLALPCDECGTYRTQHATLLGPVRLEAVVTVRRLKSVTAKWPVTRSSSDWDHYARAICDALTGVIYVDDSQIIDGRVITTYPHVHQHALGEPGAVIRIWNGGA
ncbi:hypothetical protein Ssi03_62210 [Sphaerisporangium siamense]|uniref:Uncharacterized protein n=1 Tax=Sphaerisporangium siamense TaxID=795645 RepID=A0A7W7GAM7_9ACTN|nr:RusA family crossover junction endodeoxyribonuclease [Sphaerisporangium siamense]MBB4702532.1 hypothetical protein [Sphaerisporangium siamense]GII88231.1 hypothetical protein Ssi03_62210 [Sphaerisporangium siamense]